VDREPRGRRRHDCADAGQRAAPGGERIHWHADSPGCHDCLGFGYDGHNDRQQSFHGRYIHGHGRFIDHERYFHHHRQYIHGHGRYIDREWYFHDHRQYIHGHRRYIDRGRYFHDHRQYIHGHGRYIDHGRYFHDHGRYIHDRLVGLGTRRSPVVAADVW
jgi:hypothetical protein